MKVPLVPHDQLVATNETADHDDPRVADLDMESINVTEVERVGNGMLMHVGETDKLYITGDECRALLRWLIKEYPIEALGALA